MKLNAQGRPQLMSERCSTCIFRPGNLMRLRPGRLTDMVRQAVGGGGGIVCHKTIEGGTDPDLGEAMCRGFYDAHGPKTNIVRIYERLGGFTEVPAP